MLMSLADSIFNDCVTQSSPFTVDASFQFVNVSRSWCDTLACKAHSIRRSQLGDSTFSLILWSRKFAITMH